MTECTRTWSGQVLWTGSIASFCICVSALSSRPNQLNCTGKWKTGKVFTIFRCWPIGITVHENSVHWYTAFYGYSYRWMSFTSWFGVSNEENVLLLLKLKAWQHYKLMIPLLKATASKVRHTVYLPMSHECACAQIMPKYRYSITHFWYFTQLLLTINSITWAIFTVFNLRHTAPCK